MSDHWDEDSRIAWTRTWYGRGTPLTAEECENRVREAYRTARAHLTGNLYLSADEDAYIGGDDTIPTLQPRIMFPGMWVRSEEDALRAWWDLYGSADTEANLRELGFGPWIAKYGRGMIEEDR